MIQNQTYDKIVRFSSQYAELAFSFFCDDTSCENPDYFNTYIRFTAVTDYNTGRGTTHALIEFCDGVPIKLKAYITLKTNVFVYRNNENKIDGNPAIEISVLAVSKDCTHKGYGTDLLKYAALTCYSDIRQYAGVRYLIVCAEKSAVSFYEKALDFALADNDYIVPREHWNEDCIPMYIQLPEILPAEPCYVTDDDDEEDEF